MHKHVSHTARPTILIVDDVTQNLTLLANTLGTRYALRVASSGKRALQLMQSPPLPDLVLLDVVMPDLDGYAVCRQLKADPRTRDVPVIFLTVLDDAIDEEMGLGLGAVDFIVKPVSPPVMLARIDAQLRLKAAADFLRDQNQFLENEVARRVDAAEDQYDAIIATLAALLHARERQGSKHVARVQAYLQALAGQLCGGAAAALLSEEAARLMVKAVPLHDIGMLDVPDRILFKVDALTDAEFDTVKMHAERGRAVIERIALGLCRSTPLLDMAADMAHAHQERWDGSGYPRGLAGEAIPRGARLVAVVDTYEALVSGRQYRLPVSHAQAVALVTDQRGSQFDPRVVDAFVAAADRFHEIALRLADTVDDVQVRLLAVEAVGSAPG